MSAQQHEIACLAAQLGLDGSADVLFRALTAQAPVGVFVGDASGKRLYANRRLAELSGLSDEAAVGPNWTSTLHPDERDDLLRRWKEQTIAGGEESYEYRFLHADGTVVWVSAYATPLLDARDAIVGWIGICVDVTARHVLERKFERLAAHSPDIVIRFDRSLRHLYINAAVEAATGKPPEHYLGRTNRELGLPDEQCALWERELRPVFETAQPRTFEFELADERGEVRCFEAEVVPDEIVDGRVETILSFTRDRTDARRAEVARLASERGYRELFELTPDLIVLTDRDSRITDVNPAAARTLGYARDELVGRPLQTILPPDRVDDAAARIAAKLGGDDAASVYVGALQARDGTPVPVEINSRVVVRDGERVGVLGIARDVTDADTAWRALAASEQRYRSLFERARDAIYTADLQGNFTSMNPAGTEITGYSEAELLGMSFFDLIPPDEQARAQEILARRFAGGSDEHVALEIAAKDGRRVFLDVTGSLVTTSGGSGHMVGIARDVTDRHALEEELRRRIFHDELTQLPNRTLLLDRLAQAIERDRRAGDGVAVMLLDLDDFKLVNDTLGHEAGDELLVEVANRLRAASRTSDTVARLGGDEFALVVEGVGSNGEVAGLAERIHSAFDEQFTIGETRLQITASLGITVATGDEQPSALLRDADTAMYRAKASAKGSSEFFDIAMRARLLRRLELASALGEALHGDQLEVHFQPIVALADGEILAAEALLRWSHPEFGAVDPSEFIPLAEENGLIVPLGRHVIEAAARAAAGWRAATPHALPLGVFVNLSPRELFQESFLPFLTRTLREHGLTGSDIAFELTERVFIDERDHTLVRNLEELTRRGVRLILDDFGTGYSALASLKRFPLAALKIDRYFSTIDDDHREKPVMKAIVSIGKTLGIAVIAEGVETEAQLADLRTLGCDAAQGYHLGGPMPASELTPRLAAAPPRLLALAR